MAKFLYDFAQGTGLRLSLLVALLGILYRVRQYRRLARLSSARAGTSSGGIRSRATVELPVFFFLHGRASPPGTISHPVMRTVSLGFHILLFLVPLLLPAHNILMHRRLHVSLPTIPAPLADWLTVVLVAAGCFFLVRRIFVPRVRVLSTLYDYVILLLVAAPFLTGLMMYHHVSSSRWLMIAHVLSADVLFIAIPFTRISHMPFLLFSRFFVSGEYSFGPGKRAWGGGSR